MVIIKENYSSPNIHHTLGKMVLLFFFLTISFHGFNQCVFKGTFISLSSGVKYVSAQELNKSIENWLVLNGFLPRMSSQDALNLGVSTDLTFQFPILKFVDISVDASYSYFKKEYKNNGSDYLIIDINQITPSLNALLRLGPLRFGVGGFYSFYQNTWNNNVTETKSKYKSNNFGYSFSFILLTPVIKRFYIITKGKYEIVHYKIEGEKDYFSGLTFNIGFGIKL